MRLKSFLPAIVVGLLTATSATAQEIAYINFLQFDLQSFRSQATAGIFQDDVDMVADAANLTSIEGNRLFTSFSNLNEPALLGENVLSYAGTWLGSFPAGYDPIAQPEQYQDVFSNGSYLVGWIGKYDQDSDYNFSLFYQRNGTQSAFEDLEDLNIGSPPIDATREAKYSGTQTDENRDTLNRLTDRTQREFDLQRYDDRNAMNVDFGAARDISEELAFGGRFFWEDDQLDVFSDGTALVTTTDYDTLGVVTDRSAVSRTWTGTGEEAFRNREIGVSLDADYHPWDNQSVNIRFDIFGTKIVNPTGLRVQALEQTNSSLKQVGDIGLLGSTLAADHDDVDAIYNTNYTPFPSLVPGITAVDDDRSGIGFSAKGQWDREWAGGTNRAWVGMSRRGLDIDARRESLLRTESRDWWNAAALADSTDYNAVRIREDNAVTTWSGDNTQNVLEIGTRWNRALNQHVSMGLGAILSRETWKEDYRQVVETENLNSFTDGAATPNHLETLAGGGGVYNEFDSIYTRTQTTDIDNEFRHTYVRLPVGGQFHFWDRWTVNVGVQHTIWNVENELKTVVPVDANDVGVTTFTDRTTATPTTTTTYDLTPNPDVAGRDVTITQKEQSNWTTYWYGLSVMVTDAAQLDINGIFDTSSSDRQIFDLEFFQNLAISLKYIFW